MKNRLSTLLAAVALVVAGGPFASAADLLATGKIPFAFRAGQASLPAGKYDVLRDSSRDDVLLLRDYDAKKSAIVPFETRLSQRMATKAELIFDKDANGYYLSEVYIPAMDGFYLKGAPGAHTHEHVPLGPAGK